MSLQSRLAPLITAIGADIKALKLDAGADAFYSKWFAAINPINTTGSFRDHPDGVQTYVLPTTGKYRLTLGDQVTHSGVYNYEQSKWTIGGTATRLDSSGNFDSWLPSGGQDGNRSESHVAYFSGTAGQTITFRPSCRVGAVSADVTKHEFSFLAAVELVTSKPGPKGDPGAGMKWRGVWSAATAYSAEDVVSYLGFLYYAQSANTNKNPLTEPTFWTWMDSNSPTAAQKAALGVQPIGHAPGAGNGYMTQSEVELLTATASSGNSVNLLMASGLWVIEAVFGFSQSHSNIGAALVNVSRNTGDGTSLTVAIINQVNTWSYSSTSWDVFNNGTATPFLRYVVGNGIPGQVTLFATRMRPHRV